MDDWNRTRSSKEIHCSKCKQKESKRLRAAAARERRREELLFKAKQIATNRYQKKWLVLFDLLSKKAAWKLYTGGVGYPALGTFYLHVKHHGGLNKYMKWCFENDLEHCLEILNVKDKEVQALLKERTRLWVPTEKSP